MHRWFTLSPESNEVLGHNLPGGQGVFCVAENTNTLTLTVNVCVSLLLMWSELSHLSQL